VDTHICLLAVAIAACGAHAPSADSTGVRSQARAEPAAVAPLFPIETPHGADIAALASTPDGKAVVSCDRLGGVRLWPALDGAIEPRAVDVPCPSQLALAHAQRGFVIAALDPAGGLVIEQVDADGMTRSRVAIPPRPSHLGLVMTAEGPLAWRIDSRIVRFAADGALVGELEPEADQRVLAVTVAGQRAVALVERQGVPWLRGLTIANTLAWGSWIDAAGSSSETIALSPGGRRVAILNRAAGAPGLAIVDTTSRAVTAASSPVGAFAIGFADDDHLAIATSTVLDVSPITAIEWIDLTDPRATTAVRPVLPAPPPGPTLAVAGGRAISATNGELMIATPGIVRFLGYELPPSSHVASFGDDQVVFASDREVVFLDRALNAAGAASWGSPRTVSLSALHWLAGNDWLVQLEDAAHGTTPVVLADLALGSRALLERGSSPVHSMRYSHATHLITLSHEDGIAVLRYDPTDHRITPVAKLHTGTRPADLVPTDPARARGTQLVRVDLRPRLTLRWLRDPADLAAGTTVTVTGALADVDAAGRVYVWERTRRGPKLVVHREDGAVSVLPVDRGGTLWTDLDSRRFAVVASDDVSMYALDGRRLWSQPLHGVVEVRWLGRDAIAVASDTGIMRLDAASGRVLAARCGWRFGLSETPHPAGPLVRPLCERRDVLNAIGGH
jgi:hypothetical protein